MKNIFKYLILVILVLFLVGIDQLSKNVVTNVSSDISIIPGLLNISLVKNYGAVFGIAQGSNLTMTIITGCICLIMTLAIIIFTYKRQHVSIAFYLILAGGIGNFIDRIYRGYVVDFIDTPFIATFNIADCCVVIGAFLIVIEMIFSIYKNDKKEYKFRK